MRRLLSFALLLTPSLVLAAELPRLKSIDEFGPCSARHEMDQCLEALRAHVKTDPARAFQAAKVVRRNANGWVALQFFDLGLRKKPAAEACKDEDLSLAVISGLGLPRDHEAAARARSLWGDRCFEALRPAVQKSLGEGGYLVVNACEVLGRKQVAEPACAKAAPPVSETSRPSPTRAAEPLRPWSAIDARKIAAAGEAKAFVGRDGRRVTLVPVAGDANAFLVAMEGVGGPWNNRVLLHRKAPAGTGFDYYTRVEGGDWVTLVARRLYGAELSLELHPKGDGGPYVLAPDPEASKKARAADIVERYRKQPAP